MANQGNTDGVVKKVLFMLQVGYDQRNGAVFKTLSQAVQDHDKKTVDSARATVDKVAKVRQEAEEKEKMRWATRLSRQLDQESKERDRFWAGESRKMDQRIAGASREQSLAAKSAIRDAQAMGAQLTGLRDAAAGFGKSLSYASLIGEKDMGKLTDKLLEIEAIFGGIVHGGELVSGIRKVGAYGKRLGASGPATIGAAIGQIAGPAAGSVAWGLAGGTVARTVIGGAARIAGAVFSPAGAAVAGGLALGGLASHFYQTSTGSPIQSDLERIRKENEYRRAAGQPLLPRGLGTSESLWARFTTSIPGFGPEGALANDRLFGLGAGNENNRVKVLEERYQERLAGRDLIGQLAPLFGQRAALNASVGSRNLTPAQLAVARAASMRSGNPEMLDVLQGLGRQKNDLQFRQQSLEAALPYAQGDGQKTFQIQQQLKAVSLQILEIDKQDAQVKINGYKQAKSLAEGEYNSRQGGLFDRAAAFGNSDAATQADIKRIADKVAAGQALTVDERNFAMSNAAVPASVREYADYQSFSEGKMKAGNAFAGDEKNIEAARAKAESLKIEIDASKTKFEVSLDAADGLYDQLREAFDDTFRQMADDIQSGANAAGKKAAIEYIKQQMQNQANQGALNLGS
jgi:hypothetical protein